jgi:hypothetical protein
MSIICLKIKRYAAGRKFPFDRVYIFRKEATIRAQSLTPINLVLPIKGVVRSLLEKLHIDETVSREAGRRGPSKKLPGFIILTNENEYKRREKRGSAGRSRTGVGRSILPHLEGGSPEIQALCQALDDGTAEDWRLLIPILNLSSKGGSNHSRPSYLANEKWTWGGAKENGGSRARDIDWPHKAILKGAPIVPDSAELKILDDIITPPCRACPRLLEHMHGDCQLGGDVCLSEMSFNAPTQMYPEETIKEAGRLVSWHTGA